MHIIHMDSVVITIFSDFRGPCYRRNIKVDMNHSVLCNNCNCYKVIKSVSTRISPNIAFRRHSETLVVFGTRAPVEYRGRPQLQLPAVRHNVCI